MRVHVFFSVHEQLFGRVLATISREHPLEVSGFVWGDDQEGQLREDGHIRVSPLTVFTSDILAASTSGDADLEYLARWEQRSGVLLQHMIFAERHLLRHYSYEQVLKIAELAFRRVEADFDAIRPDVYFSEDVACLVSYIHWVVARDRGIRIVLLNNSRFPHRVISYSNRYQRYENLEEIFPNPPAGTLSPEDLQYADTYIREFRERKAAPVGLMFRSRLLVSKFDVNRLGFFMSRWARDRKNPTMTSPPAALLNRARRLVRNAIAESTLFEKPVAGERFVLFPLHLQPEATTLVLAPYYLNQLALIEDIAKSLPAGYRLYVKEHIVSRGRWPLDFYRRLKQIPGVRLLGPTENARQLIQDAAAVAVITGTMGWEGLLFGKPVVTFGRVFFNCFPLVHRAGDVPKDEWPELFRRAIFEHRHDEALLRDFVACAHQSTAPGLTGNPTSYPAILDPENIQKLAVYLEKRFGLQQPNSERQPWSA
jgi:hypothetical protein